MPMAAPAESPSRVTDGTIRHSSPNALHPENANAVQSSAEHTPSPASPEASPDALPPHAIVVSRMKTRMNAREGSGVTLFVGSLGTEYE